MSDRERTRSESGVSFGLIKVCAIDDRASQLFADCVETQSALMKDFRSDALLFSAKDSEQQMLGADMAGGSAARPLRRHTPRMRLHSFESGRSIEVETFSRMVVRPSISFRMLSMEE